jgi:MFS transporter, ACS family, hexuronate transporter
MERLSESRPRSTSWKWWICGLLLCASAINYMDRQTLANAAHRITQQFNLSQEQYGNLELGFGWAFGAGSLLFGILVDRVSVRSVYPVVLVLWSATGFATGLVHDYAGLLACRTLLGFFEAGHWPCAIKTTQRLLEPKDRAMGNSVLQSGTSIGAIVTPLMMRAMLTDELSSWRGPFQVIGGFGLLWIVFWFVMVRRDDLPMNRNEKTISSPRPSAPLRRRGRTFDWFIAHEPSGRTIWQVIFSRRMLALLIIIACINTCWQTIRAWLPKFLLEGRGYSESGMLYFNSLFYIATDIGCLGAGAMTLWLHRRGRSVHRSRAVVFAVCAGLTALATAAVLLPKGWALLGMLLLSGAGALGVFPIYHALTQELSADHQGKVTGVASIAAWAFAPPAQKLFGRLIDRTGSFDLGLAVAGWLPAVGLVALWLLWDRGTEASQTES